VCRATSRIDADFMAAEVIFQGRMQRLDQQAELAGTPRAGLGARELVLQNIWVLGAYWLLAVLAKEYFSRYQMWPAPLWVPAGLAMFAALSIGREIWPGIFLGSLLTNAITFHDPVIWATMFACGNTLGAIVAAERARVRMRVDEMFASVANVSYFSAYTLLHGTITACVAVAAMWAQGVVPISATPSRWVEWMLSDASASLLLVPFLLLWRQHDWTRQDVRQLRSEFAITLASAVLALGYVLVGTTGNRAADAGAIFLILLPLLWMSVRLSLALAYPVFVAVVGAMMAGTMAGYGPFSGIEQGGTFTFFAEMTIGFSVSLLLLGGASNEQRVAERAMRGLNLDLESRVDQRTAELREIHRQLEKAAFYDSLTGLPNRRLLEERFAFCGAAARRRGDRFALLLIDLDRFKEINDNLGHDAGDALLVETGCRLTTTLRECDVVARMGGDEFVVLLPETGDRTGIESVCTRILDVLIEPMLFNGCVIRTAASIGIALFPDHGGTWQAMYKSADLALYEAKRDGRATWRWYAEEGVGRE
jgi:diguanylate cyclase (GGDEF)-like protein